MAQMAANVNNSTHLISVLNVTTGISAVLTALSLVGVIVTVTLIFAIPPPVLWPVLIGCACITVIGLIVFLSVRYASSECEVPMEENFLKNDFPIVIENKNEDSGPPFDENEFKSNPNIGDPLEKIPAESVQDAISNPSSKYFPVMVRNCIRILSQMNDTVTIVNAVRFLARKYDISPSCNAVLAIRGVLPYHRGISRSLKRIKQHLDNGGFIETGSDSYNPIKLLSFFIAIGALFQNHAIAICAKGGGGLNYRIIPFCLDSAICPEAPIYLIGNCSRSQATSRNLYQAAGDRKIPDSNVLCIHYDDCNHIQIDKFPGENEWN
jgi:hypothetical protein